MSKITRALLNLSLLLLLAPTAFAHYITLTWTPSPSAGVSYSVFRGTTAGAEGTTPILTGVETNCVSGSCTVNDNTATIPGQTYYYTAEACWTGTTACSVFSNEAFATIPVTPVTGLTVIGSN